MHSYRNTTKSLISPKHMISMIDHIEEEEQQQHTIGIYIWRENELSLSFVIIATTHMPVAEMFFVVKKC